MISLPMKREKIDVNLLKRIFKYMVPYKTRLWSIITCLKIGRNGAKLSGGEKQKLAVARAMVKDSPIVILDEATSGYDVESDSYLHKVLLKELKDKSVIMITHRYDNLEGMDRVYRLSEGSLVMVQ